MYQSLLHMRSAELHALTNASSFSHSLSPQLSQQASLLQQLQTAERATLLAEIAHLRSSLEDMCREQREQHQALVERLAQARHEGASDGPTRDELAALLSAPRLRPSEVESVLSGKDGEIGRLELTVVRLEQEKLALELRLGEAEASLQELEGSLERASATIGSLQQVTTPPFWVPAAWEEVEEGV